MIPQDIPDRCLKTSRTVVRLLVSKARLVITAVVLEGRLGLSEVVPRLRRFEVLGLRAARPLPRRGRSRVRTPLAPPAPAPDRDPRSHGRADRAPTQSSCPGHGLDAGPDTIAWHLEHHHGITVSLATIARTLTRARWSNPQPKKRPKSSYIRFAGRPAE